MQGHGCYDGSQSAWFELSKACKPVIYMKSLHILHGDAAMVCLKLLCVFDYVVSHVVVNKANLFRTRVLIMCQVLSWQDHGWSKQNDTNCSALLIIDSQ
jgi:hypothetical protein